MSSKRIRWSMDQYREIVTSLEWCRARDMTGLARYYEDQLATAGKERRLPPEVARSLEMEDDGRDQSR